MYRFPRGLYADIRMEENYYTGLGVQDGEWTSDWEAEFVSAMVRVFDGNMWYTATTRNLEELQSELDRLAELATPDPAIGEHPLVKKYEVHRESVLKFEGANDVRKVSRKRWKEILESYIEVFCEDKIPEISTWSGSIGCHHMKKSFFSSKDTEIVQDNQSCYLSLGCGITIDGVTTYGGKSYTKFAADGLLGHEREILTARERYLDFARNAVDVEPGEYTCVLAPRVTALFTHESFGHKSEADYMMHDRTLREEWMLGKQVGNEKVSICDRGDLLKNGYVPYDDEGTRARETWLIRDGVLTGRLHDANSAVALDEELTGNSRAEGPLVTPIVRMTNTFMAAGRDDPERIIREVQDGLYIYEPDYGTGQAVFTLKPRLSYRIRDGKICEPVRINVLTGSVFRALFDIDAVGWDFELFDNFSCEKSGQDVDVAMGGPTIRVKKLTVN